MKTLLPAFLISFFILAGCASQSTVAPGFTLRPQTHVALETPDFYLELRRPQLAHILTAHGCVISTNEAGALRCRAELVNGTYVRARVQLLKDGQPVLTAQASNAGWGTWLAHGAAREQVIDSALKQFNDALRNAQ